MKNKFKDLLTNKKIQKPLAIGTVVLLLISASLLKKEKVLVETLRIETTKKSREDLPENLVKVPDTYFKSRQHVEALFEQVGLEVKFVPTNFDRSAEYNKRSIFMYDCNQIEEQPNITYYSIDEAGDDYGYYAEKGATIIVGYSDHDYLYSKSSSESDEELEENSSSTEESSTSSSSSTEESSSSSSSVATTTESSTTTSPSSTAPSVIEVSVDEFTNLFDTGDVEKYKTYQFTTKPIWQEDWGMNADNTYYNIYVQAYSVPGGNDDLILRTTKSVADRIRNADSVTLQVQVRSDYFVYVVSATAN